MSTNADIPPSRSVEPIDAPPGSSRPTSAMLKADIDSGRTGDKVAVFDPGLSPLGTDDEAAGHPPTPFRIAMARRFEAARRWAGDRVVVERDGLPWGYIAFILAVAMILVVGIWIA